MSIIMRDITNEGDVMPAESTWPWFPIVMLHRIVGRVPSPNPYNLCTSAGGLDRIIRLLRAEGRRLVSLGDAIDARERGLNLSRFACLTFDDGYRDFLTHAMPVLERNEAPATLFLVSDRIGGRNVWDERTDSIEGAPLLSRDEVLGLAMRGIEFGSHSATHPYISRLPLEERDAEIAGSKRSLEALLDREVALFAYPHIDQDEDARRRVAKAGYRAAVGGEQAAHSRFLLHRVSLPRLDSLSVRARCGGWRYRAQNLKPLRVSKRGITTLFGRRGSK